MKTIQIIPKDIETILVAEYPLENLVDLPQFDRKIVVSGFNSPDLEDKSCELLSKFLRI